MRGSYNLKLESKKLSFQITIQRNITIIRGDSGTGKSTLINMLINAKREYSPYTVECNVDYHAFNSNNFSAFDYTKCSNSIVFIDEDVNILKTPEFASIVKKSDCYYVLITREKLQNLPYSCNAVYELYTESSKQKVAKHLTFTRMYYDFVNAKDSKVYDKITHIVTEDSNSGAQFFTATANANKIVCTAAGGNSNIAKHIEDELTGMNTGSMLAIVDGAALGPYYDDIEKLIHMYRNLVVYLPESFEYILLKSKLFSTSNISEIITRPYNYIESQDYFSWERFFTALLQEVSKGTEYEYSKHILKKAYLSKYARDCILAVLPSSFNLH